MRLMQRFPTTCSMIDAQLYLHKEALAVVKQNYRITVIYRTIPSSINSNILFQMDTVAHDYFYDFLHRHPRVALHYSNWFLRCKPIPPTTGCSIDMKVWTLSMIVRGAAATENMTDWMINLICFVVLLFVRVYFSLNFFLLSLLIQISSFMLCHSSNSLEKRLRMAVYLSNENTAE